MAMQMSRNICRYCFAGPFSAASGASFARGTPLASKAQATRCYSSESPARISVIKTIVLVVTSSVTGYFVYWLAAKSIKAKENRWIREEAKHLEVLLDNERNKYERLQALIQSKRDGSGRGTEGTNWTRKVFGIVGNARK